MRILLIVPSVVRRNVADAVARDTHPTMDYWALFHELERSGASVDILDYEALLSSRSGAALARFAGKDTALALLAAGRASRYDVIFSNSESVALPLSLLSRGKNRPKHVAIGHRLSTGKKRVFLKTARAWRNIDRIFVYAEAQRRHAVERLGVPADRLERIHFHADTRFFRPDSGAQVRAGQISAAGLEWRDYPTFIDSLANDDRFMVRLAAASPWSKHNNETEKRALPAHVSARRYDYDELRTLYRESFVVAVPLYENDFQAGITTMLEAMAVGRPVVVTKTSGQTDVIVDGVNGVYVPVGDARAWSDTISGLHSDPVRCRNLGHAAHQWVYENARLDLWVDRVKGALVR